MAKTRAQQAAIAINMKKQGKNPKHESAIMKGLQTEDETIDEDLRKGFKEKWVNIGKKVDGKHPPCGRPDTSKGAYPKCRAAGVAGKMSDSQKKAACAQKRKAEKKDTQTGKGQKPVMTSYKPKNESLRDLIKSVLREQTT
mgnify:CR=1 FL=1